MTTTRKLITALIVSSLLSASLPSFAAAEILDDTVSERPTVGAMILDGGLVRPLMLIATVAGAGLFVATLPFSIIGGNVKESAKTLVTSPATATFRRCLGCSVVQDQVKDDAEVQQANLDSK